MTPQYALSVTTMMVAVFGIFSSLFINESNNKRKAKPFYVSFYLLSVLLLYIISSISKHDDPSSLIKLDLVLGACVTSLTLGVCIRCKARRLEQLTYALAFMYLMMLFLDHSLDVLNFIFLALNFCICIWALFYRETGPNKSDIGFIITLIGFLCFMGVDVTSATHYSDINYYIENKMLIEIIPVPAFLSGISIFILTSYLMDSNTYLEKLATKDPMTDLFNRRALFEQIDDFLSNNKRSDNQSAAIVLADIDHFKNINDSYGHEAGDIVIKQFAADLSQTFADVDAVVSRYGGEEFLIFIPDSDAKSAYALAEIARNDFAKNSLQYDEKEISATASFGVSSYQFAQDVDSNIAKTDEALYQSKQEGRNRTTQFYHST